MNFEKRMKKRGNQKLNKFAKNPYRVPWFKRIPTWVKIATPTVLTATAAALVVVIMMPSMIGNKSANYEMGGNAKDSYPVNQSGDKFAPGSQANDPSYNTQEPEGALPWAERSVVSKYPSFTYQEVTFGAYRSESCAIEEQYINTKLADIEVTGFDNDLNKEHKEAASVYSIKNFTSEMFLALKVNSDNHYYPYFKPDALFTNIGDLVDKMSFGTESKIKKITYDDSSNASNKTITFTGYEESAIYDIIFSDLTIVGCSTNDPSAPNYLGFKDYDIYFSVPALGMSEVSIKITEYKCLVFKNCGTKEVFQLSAATYEAFTSYLETNATAL